VRAALRRGTYVVLPAAAFAVAAAPWPPALVERLFTDGWYPVLQPRLTGLTNHLPVAALDVLVGACVLAAATRVRAAWRTRTSLAGWILECLARGVRAAALVYLVFLAAWGFNYRRVPAVTRYSVDRQRVTTARLGVLATRSVQEANRLWAGARAAGPRDWEDTARDIGPAFALATRATGTAWPVVPGRPKPSLLAHTFAWAAVDGMVNPFGLEVLLNPEVLPVERPFVLAHEWAHLAGHADESEASFVGLLTCVSGPPAAQYSGWLSLLLHAAGALPAAERRAAVESLEPGPRADLRAIAARVGRAQPLVRAVSWRVYDEYLRANRVEAGVASYDAVTTLVLGSSLTASLVDPRPGPSTP
jgi:hypothetical protein